MVKTRNIEIPKILTPFSTTHGVSKTGQTTSGKTIKGPSGSSQLLKRSTGVLIHTFMGQSELAVHLFETL